MPRKKPTRARTHELEDESYTKFRAARPSAWPVHKIDGSDDYGRDLLVEVFENGQPTGNEFSVQLKATEKLQTAPKVRLKLTTLNHWDDQPSPTLVVLWDATSDRLFYEWAHRLPWTDPRREKQTRTVPLPNLWTAETPALIAREADAFRKVRNLSQHFPVDVEVTGEEFFGDDAGPVIAAVIDALAPFREFKVTFGEPQVPFVRISILPNGAEVSLSGTPVKGMTYGPAAEPPPEVIAGDVLFGLAFAVGIYGGSRDAGTALIEAAVEHSFMAMVAGRLIDAMVILTNAKSKDALLMLLGRTICVEDHPAVDEGLAGLEITKRIMTDELRVAVSNMLETAAASWVHPAKLLRTAAWMLGPLDATKTNELWDAAVAADPDTTKKPRYWAQRGGVLFLDGRWADAVDSYQHAVRLGDETSRPLLADALLWAGRYSEALKEFDRSQIREGDENAEWRLKSKALSILVDGFGFKHQERDSLGADTMWEANQPQQPTLDFIEQVLDLDALYSWAWWAACPTLRETGDGDPVGVLLLAAICALGFPPTWQELTTAALRTGNWETARDALLAARQFCGLEFLRMLHTDKIITRELRVLLLDLWGHLDDEKEFFAILERQPVREE
jgi:tetratricopeptide (TPR) repeat protein